MPKPDTSQLDDDALWSAWVNTVAVIAVDHTGYAPRSLWRPQPLVLYPADHLPTSSNYLILCVYPGNIILHGDSPSGKLSGRAGGI